MKITSSISMALFPCPASFPDCAGLTNPVVLLHSVFARGSGWSVTDRQTRAGAQIAEAGALSELTHLPQRSLPARRGPGPSRSRLQHSCTAMPGPAWETLLIG